MDRDRTIGIVEKYCGRCAGGLTGNAPSDAFENPGLAANGRPFSGRAMELESRVG
jgi:hypothetical protein